MKRTETKRPSDADLLKEYQAWLRLGQSGMSDAWKECDTCDALVESKPEAGKTKVRFLKRVATIAAEKIYPRNPAVNATPKRPVLGPKPDIDPATGMPAIDPATGDFAPPPDISEEKADVVAQVMDNEIDEISLKAEARAAIHDAVIRPGGAIECGYEFDEWRGIDAVYARRRSLKDIIVDPYASLSYGLLRDCRFVAVRHKLTEKDARARGLNLDLLPQDCLEEETAGVGQKDPGRTLPPGETDAGGKRYIVWRLWDSTRRLVAYLPAGGAAKEFPAKPEPWPWKLKTFPLHVLPLDRLPDRLFGHSAIYDLQEQQKEMNDCRTTINQGVVEARPRTLYDKQIPGEVVQRIVDGPRNSWTAVEGLAAMGGERLLVKINPEQDMSGQLEVYNLVKGEIAEIGGVSDQERLQGQALTATEAQIISEASKAATGARIDTANDWIRAVLRTLYQIMEQTYTTERVTQVVGPNRAKFWIEWTGPELLADFDIDIELGSAQRQDSETEKLVAQNLLTTLLPVPGVDVTSLGIDLLRTHGKKDADRYRLPPPQLPMPMPMDPAVEAGAPPMPPEMMPPPGPPTPGPKGR